MSQSVSAPLQESLLLLPYTRALEMLEGRNVRVTVVTPPFPCIGVGRLHVVRVTEPGAGAGPDASVELALSYDDYERLA